MSRGLTGLGLSHYLRPLAAGQQCWALPTRSPHPPSAVPAWRVPVVTLSVTLVRLLPKEAQAEARMASDRALHRLFGFVLLGPKCLGPCPHGLPSPIPRPPYHITIRFPLCICLCVCECAHPFSSVLCVCQRCCASQLCKR